MSGIETMHNFLARAFLRMFRPRMQQMNALLEQTPAFPQISWRFRLEDELNLLREIIHAFALQRHRHAASRAHGVDGDRELRRLAVDDRLFEKQRFAPIGRFHFAICPFADDQIGIDRDRDAIQFACAIERFDELRERAVGHLRNVIRFNDRQQPDCA